MSAHDHTSWPFPHVLALLGVVGLSACATPGSNGVAGAVTVPGRWQAGSANAGALDAVALAQWWERFRDPALNELVRAALAASPDVQTAVSKIAESRARRGWNGRVCFRGSRAAVRRRTIVRKTAWRT